MKPLPSADIVSLADGLRAFPGRIRRRELLCAGAGLKPVRIMAHVDECAGLMEVVLRHRLLAVEGRVSAWVRFDAGKGNWSSGMAEEGEGEEHRLVYVADTAEAAESLRAAEEFGDSEAFGRALLVPACCRVMFRTNAAQAHALQNDFFGHSFGMAVQDVPWGLNLAAQYFDAALVSHYPCGPHCRDSLRLARLADRIVSALLPEDAKAMRRHMRRTGIYSEYDGVCLLDCTERRPGEFGRDSSELLSTFPGRLTEARREAERFRVRGTELECWYAGGSRITAFEGLRVLRPTGLDGAAQSTEATPHDART